VPSGHSFPAVPQQGSLAVGGAFVVCHRLGDTGGGREGALRPPRCVGFQISSPHGSHELVNYRTTPSELKVELTALSQALDGRVVP
jgi:hypothetical protein